MKALYKYHHNVAESYYQLSQLNIKLNEPAFLFGINYVVLSNDDSFRRIRKMFEVSYIEENKIEMEAQLFAVQLLFQYLFAQGRFTRSTNVYFKTKR